MTEPKHVHKLKRHRYKTGNTVYFCVDNCAFKVSTELALGKKCICWRCGQPFTLTEYSIRLAKPHCGDCHKPKGAILERTEVPDFVSKHPPEIEAKGAITLPKDSAADLRSRLTGVLHSGLQAKPDEEDI